MMDVVDVSHYPGLTPILLQSLNLPPQLKTWQLTAFINPVVPRYRPPLAARNRPSAANS